MRLGVVSPASAPITDVWNLKGRRFMVSRGTTAKVGLLRTHLRLSWLNLIAMLMLITRYSMAAAMLSQPTTPRYLPGSSLTLALLLALMTWATSILLPLQFTRVTPRCWSLSTTRLPALLQRRTSSTRLMKRLSLQFMAMR